MIDNNDITWEIVEILECVNFPLFQCFVAGIDTNGNRFEGSCLIEDPEGACVWGNVYDREIILGIGTNRAWKVPVTPITIPQEEKYDD